MERRRDGGEGEGGGGKVVFSMILGLIFMTQKQYVYKRDAVHTIALFY